MYVYAMIVYNYITYALYIIYIYILYWINKNNQYLIYVYVYVCRYIYIIEYLIFCIYNDKLTKPHLTDNVSASTEQVFPSMLALLSLDNSCSPISVNASQLVDWHSVS